LNFLWRFKLFWHFQNTCGLLNRLQKSHKTLILSLKPLTGIERERFRQTLGFSKQFIVGIFVGKLWCKWCTINPN
jgi:hypothetical protein